MKTLKKTPIFMFLMLVTAFAMSACGKSNNNTTANLTCSTTPNSYGTTGYGYSGYGYSGYSNGYNTGVLYQTGTATQVSAAQCATVNGVATNGATTYGTGTTGGVCNGVYYSPQYGRQGLCELVSAYQSTCYGMTLVNQYGQTVVCQ